MQVKAKMRVTSITKTGDAKKPQVSVQLGAVYSSDPQSENRSFANATPSGSLNLCIDAGKPAADAFAQGEEWYVDLTRIGVPERTYVKDWGFVPGEVVVESRDKSKSKKISYTTQNQLVDVDGQVTTPEKLVADGFEFWRHPREGE
jgi:hypothetical protein